MFRGDRLSGRTRRARTRRQRIDHLAWARVMQLFAGLVFNRVRVMLQSFDVPLQQVILPLQAVQLTIQRLRIFPLLLIHRKAILPKNDVVPHRQSENRSSARYNLSPTHLTSLIKTRNRTRLLYRARIA